MGEKALSLTNAVETRWTIRSGPFAGAVKVLSQNLIYLGRSQECELAVVNDPKVSRKHAEVKLTEQGFQLIALSESNGTLLNGQPITLAILNDGDVVTIGDTEVQFNIANLPVRREPAAFVRPAPPMEAPIAQPQYSRPKRTKAQGSNKNRLFIYGTIGLILWFFLSPSAQKKKKELEIRTEQQIQADIETANKLREAAEKTRKDQLDPRVSQRQAQENYVKGFRDYRKGQYERALDSFQACLALQPDHQLCTRYQRLAQRKFNELIQYQIVLGRKYRDQNQFKACRSAFRNVMVMVKDAQSAAYKEAKANYEACHALVEGRF